MPMRDFNRIPDFIRRLRPTIMQQAEAATEDTYEQMIEKWEKGMDTQGRPWQPLSPITIRLKGHDDILIETGEMKDSAGWEVDGSNMTAEIYVEDPKILYHEFGTEKIPRRPVLGPTFPVFVENMDDAVGEGIDEAYRGAAVTSGLASALKRR